MRALLSEQGKVLDSSRSKKRGHWWGAHRSPGPAWAAGRVRKERRKASGACRRPGLSSRRGPQAVVVVVVGVLRSLTNNKIAVLTGRKMRVWGVLPLRAQNQS